MTFPAGEDGEVRPGRGHRATARAEANLAFLYAGTARPVADSLPAPGWEAERLWSGAVDWEPVVGADPGSERVYQLAARHDPPDCPGCPNPVIVLRISADGGRTWGEDRYPFRSGSTQADPRIVVAADGTVFAAFMQDFSPGVVVSRSDDGGASWRDPVPVVAAGPARWSDHPVLAVSADARSVYVGFNAGQSYVVASHDGGRTFGRPVRTSSDDRHWFHTGATILADGTVLIAAVDTRPDYRGPVGINVLRSSDGGRTWGVRTLDRSQEPPGCSDVPGCYLGFLGPRADIAVSPSGTAMLVYTAGDVSGAAPGLWVRASKDGRSWSEPRPVAPSARGVTHAFPVVLAGSAPEEFRLLWQDDREGSWNTWTRQTTDVGCSWSEPLRLSRGRRGAGYNSGRGYDFPYGDYFGAAVDGEGRTHVVWGAGESWKGHGGAWYTRTVQRR